MTTVEALTQVFYDNFQAYFRSHAAHANVKGRTFRSDHKMLGGVYERRQAQIDIIAELLRTLQAEMPADIFAIADGTNLPTEAIEGSADELLQLVKEDLEHLCDCYKELMVIASDEKHEEISNYCQDQILDLNKSIWMLTSTLED